MRLLPSRSRPLVVMTLNEVGVEEEVKVAKVEVEEVEAVEEEDDENHVVNVTQGSINEVKKIKPSRRPFFAMTINKVVEQEEDVEDSVEDTTLHTTTPSRPPSYSIQTLQDWDIKMEEPHHHDDDLNHRGKLISTIGGITNSLLHKNQHKRNEKKQRLLAIEIHRTPIDGDMLPVDGEDRSSTTSEELSYYEKCFIRIMSSTTQTTTNEKKQMIDVVEEEDDDDDDAGTDSTDDSSSGSNSNGSSSSKIDEDSIMMEDCDDYKNVSTAEDRWEIQYKLPLYNLQIIDDADADTDDEKCRIILTNTITQGVEEEPQPQEKIFIFNSPKEVQEFKTLLNEQTSFVNIRRTANINKAIEYASTSTSIQRDLGLGLGTVQVSGVLQTQTEEPSLFDEKMKFLIEIVGIMGDELDTTDSFVMIKFGNKLIHKTEIIRNVTNPIWTVKTKAFFIFETTFSNLFDPYKRFTFTLCTKKRVYRRGMKKHYEINVLGTTSISPFALFKANEERIELAVIPFVEKGDQVLECTNSSNDGRIGTTGTGTLSIRCRRATSSDIKFVDELYHQDEDDFMSKIKKARNEKSSLTNSQDDIDYEIMYSDKPFVYTDTNLQDNDLVDELMKPSQSAKVFGHGKLGKIWLEVLQCSDLPPKKQHGLGLLLEKKKTNAFVNVVYEDCVSRTDTINDSYEPKWIPSTNRAFCLNMMYPSSPIFLGVFDNGAGPLRSHNFIGRAVVDVTKLKPDTEYILKYNLWDTAMKSKRLKKGEIMIRVRMEIDDPRRVVLSYLRQPPKIRINSNKAKKHACIEDSCIGTHDTREYSLVNIIRHLEEIVSYKDVAYYLMEGARNILFWRCVYPLTLRVPCFKKEKVIFLPMSSFIVFVTCTIGIERPILLPSVFFFLLGSFFSSVMTLRGNNPNPWSRCHSFTDILWSLCFGKLGQLDPEQISSNEKYSQEKSMNERHTSFVQEAKENASNKAAAMEKEKAELDVAIEEAGGDGASELLGHRSGSILHPLKPLLFPVQQLLLTFTQTLRFGRNVLMGDEPYFTFWLSFGSFAIAGFFIVVPWGIVLKWVLRALVWCFLGPWMSFFDVKEENLKQKERREHRREEERENIVASTRIENENIVKRKDMEQYRFGKFVTEVPVLKLDRLLDDPLPSSSATPYDKKTLDEPMELIKNDELKGQYFIGPMLPEIAEGVSE